MLATKRDAAKDNVTVPLTRDEYCIKHQTKPKESDSDIMTDFYADDYGDDMDDEEEDELHDDNEDSGNAES